MEYVIKQAYMKVIREVSSIGKSERKEERWIYLYEDNIRTKYHTFPLENMLGITFKPMTGEGGILYLHTNHGVYSYQVLSSPQAFIKEVRLYLEGSSC